MRNLLKSLVVILSAAIVTTTGVNAAVITTFEDIDGDGQGPTFADQVVLEIIDNGGIVGFQITNNTGGIFGIIEQVNFDDSALDLLGALDSLVQTNNVDFSEDLANLPQGNNVGFDSTDGFQSNPPAAGANANGIQPGDSLTINFALNGGATFDDVVAALISGELRLGIHVIAFADGSSDALVSAPPPSEVPVPAAFWVMGVGLAGGLRYLKRRKIAA